jgi:hypothetical protein
MRSGTYVYVGNTRYPKSQESFRSARNANMIGREGYYVQTTPVRRALEDANRPAPHRELLPHTVIRHIFWGRSCRTMYVEYFSARRIYHSERYERFISRSISPSF